MVFGGFRSSDRIEYVVTQFMEFESHIFSFSFFSFFYITSSLKLCHFFRGRTLSCYVLARELRQITLEFLRVHISKEHVPSPAEFPVVPFSKEHVPSFEPLELLKFERKR